MAISHADHDHPNTPGARAKCRKAMSVQPHDASTGTTPTKKVQYDVDPRPGYQPNRTKPRAASKSVKKPGTYIRTIGDLADVPRMLAYGARLAWANEWLVRVGDPFKDDEAHIEIDGTVARVTLMWRVSNPEGVSAIRIRNYNSSVSTKVSDIQTAVAMAGDPEVWDQYGNPVA
jgi:hypothetical protein